MSTYIKSENDIKSNWRGDINVPLVSIRCMTYNHEKYISDAIEGFIMQKTNFPFEIIIHDDASSDGTVNIIKDYEKRYPTIIKTIYESENQYSKNDRSLEKILDKATKGKYTAFCEGDDYWIDPFKLQKQVDYMETHPDCTLCFTNAILCGSNKGDMIKKYSRTKYLKKKSYDYDCGEMALLDFVPTASLFMPSALLREIPRLSPESFSGDTLIRLFCTNAGYAHYINEKTCAYRVGVENSIMYCWNSTINNRIASSKKIISLFEELDVITNQKWHEQFMYNVNALEANIILNNGEHKKLLYEKYKRIYFDRGIKGFIQLYMLVYANKPYNFIRNIIRGR